MNFTLKNTLDLRRSKKNGTFPVCLRIYRNGKFTQIRYGYSVFEKDWDDRRGVVRNSCKTFDNITRVNHHIDKEKAKYWDKIINLSGDRDLESFSLTEIKNILTNKEKVTLTVFEFNEVALKRLKDQNKIGNFRVYKDVMNSVRKYRNGRDFSFN